jgi:hypothetical protein
VARFKEKLFGRASDRCGVVWCGQFFLETGSSEGHASGEEMLGRRPCGRVDDAALT